MQINSTITEIIPIKWNAEDNLCEIIDQTKLPYKLEWVKISKYEAMADAIKHMLVRGAPLIGISAAYGLIIAIQNFFKGTDYKNDETPITPELLKYLQEVSKTLNETRPTAVNLAWALNLMNSEIQSAVLEELSNKDLYERLLKKAIWIQKDDLERCKKMGDFGAEEIKKTLGTSKPLNILTHCNAGALATGGYGTALGVIRSLHRDSLINMVYSDETRPRQQGSRLTVWELAQEGIPVTMNADTMSAFLMANGNIDAVVVGSDRIAANGDVANKIGTYQLAILANYHKIPFYVIAPESTIDFNIKDGSEIPIEYRNSNELSHINGSACTFIKDSSPESNDFKSAIEVKYTNPGFDVTPNHLISGIITEKGLRVPPLESLENPKHLNSIS